VLDLVGPFIVMDGDHDRYEELRDQCSAGADLAGSFSAMDCGRPKPNVPSSAPGTSANPRRMTD
jgi:hypothetical protein